MTKSYYRTPEMVTGGEFRCYNCNKALVKKVSGSVYELELVCPRCKAHIKVTCKEPIPVVGEQLVGGT